MIDDENQMFLSGCQVEGTKEVELLSVFANLEKKSAEL